MTMEEARAWRAGWTLVEEALAEELRRTPVEVKARQLAALKASAEALGAAEKLKEEDEEVWALWQRLRRSYGV